MRTHSWEAVTHASSALMRTLKAAPLSREAAPLCKVWFLKMSRVPRVPKYAKRIAGASDMRAQFEQSFVVNIGIVCASSCERLDLNHHASPFR